MLIAINKRKNYTCRAEQYTVFDTKIAQFKVVDASSIDVDYEVNTVSTLDYQVQEDKYYYVLLGKKESQYVICKATCEVYVVPLQELKLYKVTNIYYNEGIEPHISGASEIPNVEQLFAKDTADFVAPFGKKMFYSRRKAISAVGITRRPVSYKELCSENTYYKIAKRLNIPCIEVASVKYAGEWYLWSRFDCSYMGMRTFTEVMEKENITEAQLVEKYGIVQDFFNAMLLDFITGQGSRTTDNLILQDTGKLYPMFNNGGAFSADVITELSRTHRAFIYQNLDLLSDEMKEALWNLWHNVSYYCESSEDAKCLEHNLEALKWRLSR